MENFEKYFEKFKEILAYQLGQNTVLDFLMAFLFFVALFVAFQVFKKVGIEKLKKIAKRTKNKIVNQVLNVVADIPWFFYCVISLYFPLKTLTISSEVLTKIIDGIFIVVLVYQVIRALMLIIEYGFDRLAEHNNGNGKQSVSTFSGVTLIVRVLLWSIGGLLILSNLGVDVTSLVASLGIGGIAVALAVQNILVDVFSSFSIYFDKPFEVGDYIMVGKDGGTVKKIGLKTTRLQTLQGEELIVSNKELTTTRVQNFKRLKKRRVVFNVGVTYNTNSKKLKKVNDIVKKVIDGVKNSEFDRSHFVEFGEFSLNFEIVYFVPSSEYVDYMNMQQEINFGLKEAFEKEGIDMAFPTQTVYLEK